MNNKIVVYLLTLLSFSTFYGQMGTYSMIKKPFRDEFSFRETFLGISSIISGTLDMISQLGTILGSFLFLTFPLKKLKRDFFALTTISCILTVFLIAGKWMGNEKIIVFDLIYFAVGVIKASSFCPFMILSHYFD